MKLFQKEKDKRRKFINNQFTEQEETAINSKFEFQKAN